jgi:hypothetical protein
MSDNAIPLFALVLLRIHIELQLQQNFFFLFFFLKSEKLTTESQAAKIDMGMFVEGGGRNGAFV